MIKGTLIDERYFVEDVISTRGGMGTILRVKDTRFGDPDVYFAMKYCRDDKDESLKRFRREARLMNEFAGNEMVVQLVDLNLDHDPPYIVMPIYEDGDLSTYLPGIINDNDLLEQVFVRMAECVKELHKADKLHRDIKPSNFLRSDNGILISDLGLGMEFHSNTLFTTPSMSWGTDGYRPPEFHEDGGFANATAQSDIYMLGKSYYNLATGGMPMYVNMSSLHPTLAGVIQKCIEIEPKNRYSTVTELLQSLAYAFAVISGRMSFEGTVDFLADSILELAAHGEYDIDQINNFIDQFASLTPDQGWNIIAKIPSSVFSIFAHGEFEPKLQSYLQHYGDVVLTVPGSFSYAEDVASAMFEIFRVSQDPIARDRAFSIACEMAEKMNRFVAMDTCTSMVTSVQPHDPVGPYIAATILRLRYSFLRGIQESQIKSPPIRAAVNALKTEA